MNDLMLDVAENQNRNKAVITTALLMVILLLVLVIFGMYRMSPPPDPIADVSVFLLSSNPSEGNNHVATTDASPSQPVATSPTIAPLTSSMEAPVVNTPTNTTPEQKPDIFSAFTGFNTNQNNNTSNSIPTPGKPGNNAIGFDGAGINEHLYLPGRNVLLKEQPIGKDNTTGTVRIQITVNSQGKVIKAIYSSVGSTTVDSYLKQISIDAAMKWEWSADPQNRPEQVGWIDFVYKAQ